MVIISIFSGVFFPKWCISASNHIVVVFSYNSKQIYQMRIFFSNIFMLCILKVSSYLSFIPLMCSKKSFIHIMFCCVEILNLENSFMGRHKIWFNIIIWLKLARCPALIAWVSRSDTRSGSNTRWNLYCTMERYISRTLNLIWYFQTELLFDIPKLNYSFL